MWLVTRFAVASLGLSNTWGRKHSLENFCIFMSKTPDRVCVGNTHYIHVLRLPIFFHPRKLWTCKVPKIYLGTKNCSATALTRSGKWEALHVKNLSLCQKGSCHKRQKPQAPTPQAPIRNRQSVTAKREKSQTPKVLTAILTLPNLT